MLAPFIADGKKWVHVIFNTSNDGTFAMSAPWFE